MTAAPHTIDATLPEVRTGWRFSSTEVAIVLLLLLATVGFGAVYVRGAVANAYASAAAAQLRVLAPTIEAYGLDHSGYAGMTPAALERDYGASAASSLNQKLTISASSGGYCIQVQDGDRYAAQRGPGAAIETSQAPIC